MKVPENLRGGWSTQMQNQENQFVDEPPPWRRLNLKNEEGESKRRYLIYNLYSFMSQLKNLHNYTGIN